MSVKLRVLTWLSAACGAALVLTQPVSVETERVFGLSALAAMAGVWMFMRGALARQLFIGLGVFIVARYFVWRVTETLPPASDPVGLFFGLILLAAEAYCGFIFAISLTVNVDPLKRKDLPRDPDQDLPTVDVFIPTYNETRDIIAVTVAAAKSMDYPAEKLKVYLLDDGGTDQKCNDENAEKAAAARERRAEFQKLCKEMGATYLTRARNQHAKAGNLNAGLKHSFGEIVVVFDADHAPFRAFLRETVGHFQRDEKLFLVQTPHVFLNPDPVEKNLRTFHEMPSENEMFYSTTQRGLDKWNGSFFCGSAALLRRSALEEAGGFSGVTITEDCETAFHLHGRGWTSVFVDKPLIAGLQPETFSSFIGQRSRWCQGMIQLMLLKNPFFAKGLAPMQRLAYLSSMTFWLFPFPRLIFMLAPLLYIFYDVKIFVANVEEAIAYTAIYIVANMMMQNYLYGSLRWPWVSEIYEYVQGVFLFRAIISTAMAPRKPTFNVTAKGETLDHDFLSELSWPFFLIWGFLVAGEAVAIWRYIYDPDANSLMLVVGLWTAFNLVIAGAALGAVSERRQPDRYPRLGVDRQGALEVNGELHPVLVKNVSAGGCAFAFADEAPYRFGASAALARLHVKPMPGAPLPAQALSLPLRITRGGPGPDGLHGAVFDTLRDRDYFALAELMYGDSEALPRFLMSRRRHKTILAGTARVMLWGVREPFRALRYAIWPSGESSGQEAPAPSPAPNPGRRAPVDAAYASEISAALLRQTLDLAAARMAREAPRKKGEAA
ncbi:cellulose synthase (UDP-forming) [Rhodoblastus acidophilus]|uniref:UDP-forming cellulose synthase catalytic subunit n=1 Tax=Rhodoblastus acidophilus TaxID=1074 RepID=UPI0022246ED2|nr:UDP-forming cellulose synthase catalytic subunit [Rhodoblastus acidophilus]MCW2285475.1 cellulose synthase (UDP-forming) [Rhodoblastus acidophilus]MCW2334441.1 cellulose synthase (UDP-forming) [Rhodoblastus acidophilus]